MIELARFALGAEADVFTVRHWGREIATGLGFDEHDQVRIATALSEVGREVLGEGGGGSAVFEVDEVAGALGVRFECRRQLGEGRDDTAFSGVAGAARLVDAVERSEAEPGTVVRLRKRVVPHGRVRPGTVAGLRERLGTAAEVSPLDELRRQNEELLAALDELTARQAALEQLNEEIRETNQGVMAMYHQLSGELEETNRGVVALYAELDERTLEAQVANEAKSRFLASVSHELRAPVTSMLALVGLLADPDGDPLTGEQRRQVELIGSAGQDLLRLVNELLDLAKAESGRLGPTIEPVELAPLFAELRGAFRPLVSPGVTLAVADPVGLPPIETDRGLLAQVLRNLLSNATKFTERGEVRASAVLSRSGGEVELTVADTGIGIASENQANVFEEFFQVRGPLQAKKRGSGLGLAYVRRVVEALGGTAALESEPGVGTTVTVVLPCRTATQAGGVPPAPAGEKAPVRLGTVLVVDDDPAFRHALAGMLDGVAGQVLEAGDGAEALAAVRASRPDLVFLDLRMPGLDGTEVLAQMAGDPGLRSVPVVVVTSADLSDLAPRHVGHARARLSKAHLDQERLEGVLAGLATGGGT